MASLCVVRRVPPPHELLRRTASEPVCRRCPRCTQSDGSHPHTSSKDGTTSEPACERWPPALPVFVPPTLNCTQGKMPLSDRADLKKTKGLRLVVCFAECHEMRRHVRALGNKNSQCRTQDLQLIVSKQLGRPSGEEVAAIPTVGRLRLSKFVAGEL